jgi:hypothetical protein
MEIDSKTISRIRTGISILKLIMNKILAILILTSALTITAHAGDVPYAQRDSPYSMVYYHLSNDPQVTRAVLGSIRDMGVTRTLALVYWWQAETLGGDYWKKDYREESLNEGFYRAMDNYVHTSVEFGMKPSLRLGSFREWDGLWHPADPSGSVENYAKWVGKIASRYKGQIDHYVIGDEENKPGPGGFDGSAKMYMEKMFIPLARAIRSADPDAGISACGASSAPSTEWQLDLIQNGLPKYGTGVACNFWYGVVEDTWQVERFMKDIRKAWPKAKFYANGTGYVINNGQHDRVQAAIVAQTMFTLWDVGWTSAPYYLYGFSMTADTKQNYGLIDITGGEGHFIYTDAWKAYQTIAQTFYNRDDLKQPKFKITTEPSEVLKAEDGVEIRLAPPDPVVRAYIRDDSELLLYVAYRNLREPRDGRLNIALDSAEWADPRQIPLLDFTQRDLVAHKIENGKLVLTDIPAGRAPTIITLRKAVP